MEYVLLLLFGVGVGVISGLLGIGGGVALVPGLVLLFGFSQREAQGTSLAVLIPPIGIFAAMAYYRQGDVRLPVVGWVALGFMAGAYLGALLVSRIPQSALQACFGAVLLYVGWTFLFAPITGPRAAALPAGIASLISGAIAIVFRRWKPKSEAQHPPRDDEPEYHI